MVLNSSQTDYFARELYQVKTKGGRERVEPLSSCLFLLISSLISWIMKL